MLNLQDVLNNIALVIINYKETMNGEQISTLLNLTHSNMNHFFNAEVSTRTRELRGMITRLNQDKKTTRDNLLLYFVYIIEEIQPFLDQNRCLDDKEAQRIILLLSEFLKTNITLLNLHQNYEITVNYNRTPQILYGFGQWSLTGRTHSYVGLIINKLLVQPLILPLDLGCEINCLNIAQKLLAGQQQELRLRAAAQELEQTKQKLGAVQENFEKSNEQLRTLEQALKESKEEPSDDQQAQKIKQLTAEITGLRATMHKLKQSRASIPAPAIVVENNEFFEEFKLPAAARKPKTTAATSNPGKNKSALFVPDKGNTVSSTDPNSARI